MSYHLTTAQYLKLGWVKGIEPLTSRATIWRSSQLSYTHHVLARLKGLEPLAHCLEGSCSIQLSYRRISHKAATINGKNLMERVMGIEPTQSAWKAEILPLNYTRPYQSDYNSITTQVEFVNTFLKKSLNIYIKIFYVSNRGKNYLVIIVPIP